MDTTPARSLLMVFCHKQDPTFTIDKLREGQHRLGTSDILQLKIDIPDSVIPENIHFIRLPDNSAKPSRDNLYVSRDLYTGILFIPDLFLSWPYKFLCPV
jgi:hypothetical protein